MTEAVVVALITGGLALAGSIIATWTANSKTIYRISELEKKQEKYNNLQERTALNEKDIKNIYHQIDEIKGEIKNE